ncbi:MAG: hypothetical protein KDD44_08855, partial [Bdellovibrionales bacterium]|nr:hypothetical protein [Bdellovibrionales bacterium]
MSALRAQRRLALTSRDLGTSLQRLSSGLRINRPSDDAAGLAISESLRAESAVTGRARKNVSDGISALSIAEGAVSEIANMLTRMAELAEQASNGALGSEQRTALTQEFYALDQEIRRITDSTEFNGIGLLGGTPVSDLNFEQLTDTTAAGVQTNAAISADGRYLTFADYSDSMIKQTDLVTGETTTIGTISVGGALSASASGAQVVFQSTADLTGENSGGAQQLFLWDRDTGGITQVTNTTGVDVLSQFTISGDGSTIALMSNTDYITGGSKSDATGNDVIPGLFTYDVASQTYTHTGLETAGAVYGNLSLSSSGNYLSFISNTNATGQNGDGGAEIFRLDLTTDSLSLVQVTN